MADFQSDAFVFFGATGDLAHKQIFPSLQGLIRDEGFNLPIIGVAKAGWNLDQLKARAKDSLEKHGGLDQEAFNKLTGLLRYVDGDYNDPKAFAQLRKELGSAKQPLHYFAIPPSLFGTVAEGLAKSGCAENARVVVEKPFGRDLASAQELNRILHRYFPKNESSASIIFWERNRYRTFSIPASLIQCLNRSGVATTCEAFRSPWRRSSELRIAASSTTKPARCGMWFKITCCKSWPSWPWIRRPERLTTRGATRRPRCSRRYGRLLRGTSCADSTTVIGRCRA
jgi:hypothetical protein